MTFARPQRLSLLILLCLFPAVLSCGAIPNEDWAGLGRYRDENAKVGSPKAGEKRVVFMGDSLTDGWGHGDAFFTGKPYFNRGISGQTTPQMLIRFRPDVIDLKPKAVIILAGTNDIAGNTGPMTLEMTEGNLMSMAELAKANGIKVILASVLPAKGFPWRPEIETIPKIAALNDWIKAYAARNHFTYLDYFSSLDDGKGAFRADWTSDGVHPNAAGYAVMKPLAERAIEKTLSKG